CVIVFFFQAEDGIRDFHVTGVQTCALPISSYSRPEVPVGGDEGASYFQNGRVTLEWKGMSRIGDRACALVGFDSGESDFRMAMEPAPGMPMTVKGGSQYWGDLYIDAETLWLERADF